MVGEPLPAFPWLSDRFLRQYSSEKVVESELLDDDAAWQHSIAEGVRKLVPDACFDHFISAEHLPKLERVIFDGYLRGLRTAGWNDDPRLAQLGMWSASVKYDWLTLLTLAQVGQDRQYRYGGEGEIDAAFKFRERSQALRFVAGWARQAIDLADQLGM